MDVVICTNRTYMPTGLLSERINERHYDTKALGNKVIDPFPWTTLPKKSYPSPRMTLPKKSEQLRIFES